MPYGHLKEYCDLVREARKKRIAITKEQQKEIQKIYTDLAADLSSRLSRHSDKTLTYRWLKDYAKELRRESKGVCRTIQGITEKNMLAVTSAVTGAESTYWSKIVPALSERFSDVFSKIPGDVVNELLNGGVYKDFTGLSERIWNYQGKFNRDIQYVINQGIIAKKPAYDLAKDLEIYLNPKAKKPFEWSRVYPKCYKSVDYNAQRLARTSITHAYQMSFQRSTKDNPFVEEYEWLSSNSGRSCELCRQRNGKHFQKDNLPLDHPNGMCTVIAVIPKSYEQIADELADWANGKENPELDKWLNPDSKRGTIISGAISGARNPYGKGATEHAQRYYGLVRSMKTDVVKISNVTGVSQKEIQEIKDFIFNDKHDLGGIEPQRFEPDYMMAESWQRLIEGKPQKHDITLIKHEQMERRLMAQGMSQDEAHIEASRKYNYNKEANEFYGKISKFKKEK